MEDKIRSMADSITDQVYSYHENMPGFDGFPTWGTLNCFVKQGMEGYKSREAEIKKLKEDNDQLEICINKTGNKY